MSIYYGQLMKLMGRRPGQLNQGHTHYDEL